MHDVREDVGLLGVGEELEGGAQGEQGEGERVEQKKDQKEEEYEGNGGYRVEAREEQVIHSHAEEESTDTDNFFH